LSDLNRVDRIVEYLRSLSRDFLGLCDLAVAAATDAEDFAKSPNLPEEVVFQEAIDDYVSERHGPALKVFFLRIPKTLNALSRNYYYVPDHWLECFITIPFVVDSEATTVRYKRETCREWQKLRGEVEKEIWRIRNQPGYLTTEAKLRLVKHEHVLDPRHITGEVDGQGQISSAESAADRSGLSETQRAALLKIKEEGPILGKALAKRIDVEESTLRRHILPALKPHGVRNGRGGYYVAPRSTT
jgi:hypothetical protein